MDDIINIICTYLKSTYIFLSKGISIRFKSDKFTIRKKYCRIPYSSLQTYISRILIYSLYSTINWRY